MKERNVSVPLNLIATKIADTLPSQTRRSPHLFACAQKISTLFFPPLLLDGVHSRAVLQSDTFAFPAWELHERILISERTKSKEGRGSALSSSFFPMFALSSRQ